MASPPECLQCGVCCFSQLPDYVRVLGSDYERLADRAEELVHFVGNRAFMAMTDGHCRALSLKEPGGQWVCGTYETRPEICRELERGSAECRGELSAKRQRPIALRRRS